MFCTKCGSPIPEHARFCTKCGAPQVEEEPVNVEPIQPEPEPIQPEPEPIQPEPEPIQPEPEPIQPEPEVIQPEPEAVQPEPEVVQPEPEVIQAGATPLPPPPAKGPEGKKKSKLPLILPVVAVLVAALAVGGFFLYRTIHNNALYAEAMETGAMAMENNWPGDAQEWYRKALDLRPDSEEAKEGLVRAAIAQAEELLDTENFARAEEVLASLKQEEGGDYAQVKYLLAVARLSPEITQVDVGSFPVVAITLSCGENALEEEMDSLEIRVVDNGQERPLRELRKEKGQIFLSYETDEAGYQSEEREVTVFVEPAGYSFQRSGSYITPYFEPASVRLVSTDVSDYPTVRAYFRVERDSDRATVEGLNAQSFRIMERVQGGEYLAREVRAVSPLESQGLNIDLVADKSSSISETDMGRIKDVMREFVFNLRFDVGDRAEVLAFDDIVQQMCYFTNDPDLLVNGIYNMSTDGLTAFYDAVYSGVRNAALQGGARCVIAFTDGMDNRSVHTAYEVIRYANTNQVPVYIIGVGSNVEASVLRDMATNTGGRYWFISDLYDLQEIFDQVYAEQKELYMVEYVSDGDAGQYDPRELQVSVTGGGYKGATSASFTPVFSVRGMTHESRYELVPGACTWEEANRRCQEMGGHLATITSQAEMDELIALAEANDCKYIWLGGYTSYDFDGNVFGHWVTGEDFSYQAWGANQPSRQDMDGTPEWYIMLWNIRGVWSWNDQRNDPAAVSNALKEHMCFICEYES